MKRFLFTTIIAFVCCFFVGCKSEKELTVDNVNSIVVCSEFSNETFYVNDIVELKDYTVLVTYESGATETLKLSSFGFSLLDTASEGEKTLTFSYKEKSCSINYTVLDILPVSAMYKGEAIEFYRNEIFDFSNVFVSVLYNNGEEKNISLTEFTLSERDNSLSCENKTFTASIEGVSVSISYTVTNRPIKEGVDYNFDDTLNIHGDKAVKIRFVEGFFILHNGEGNIAVPQTVTSADYNRYFTYETLNNVFPTTVYFYLVNDTIYCELEEN